MAYKITGKIKHGKQGEIFDLVPNQIVDDDFFTEDEIKRLTKPGKCYIEKIQEVQKIKIDKIESEPQKQFLDLTKMTVVEAKEALAEEYDLTALEKYLDQERFRGPDERVTLTRFISARIYELTGR